MLCGRATGDPRPATAVICPVDRRVQGSVLGRFEVQSASRAPRYSERGCAGPSATASRAWLCWPSAERGAARVVIADSPESRRRTGLDCQAPKQRRVDWEAELGRRGRSVAGRYVVAPARGTRTTPSDPLHLPCHRDCRRSATFALTTQPLTVRPESVGQSLSQRPTIGSVRSATFVTNSVGHSMPVRSHKPRATGVKC